MRDVGRSLFWLGQFVHEYAVMRGSDAGASHLLEEFSGLYVLGKNLLGVWDTGRPVGDLRLDGERVTLCVKEYGRLQRAISEGWERKCGVSKVVEAMPTHTNYGVHGYVLFQGKVKGGNVTVGS